MGFKQWLKYLLLSFFLPKNLKTFEWKMLRLLNRDRRRHGLPPLFMQEDLRRVARMHSKDMAKLDYFEHKNWRGQTHVDRLKEAKVSDVVSGENLAKIGGFNFPVHRAEKGLMNSPGHRANILNTAYNCVGVGLHLSDSKVYYFTQNFAKRDLIFSKRPKSYVSKRNGVKLHFKPVGSIHSGVFRISDSNGVIKEKGFPIKKGSNLVQIQFQDTGNFQVEIFTGRRGQKTLKLSNRFNVRVGRGWFG